MDVSTLDVPVDLLSDYDDGFDLMKGLLSKRSAAFVVAYSEDCGDTLDKLATGEEHTLFFCGLVDALASQTAAAVDRIPELSFPTWMKDAIVHVEVNGRDKTFRVERRIS